MHIDLLAFLQTILTTVLTFSGGVIPLFVVGWIVDRAISVIPVLKPFRELIVQWVQKRLTDIKLERAGVVVTTTGEQFRNTQNYEASHIGTPPTDQRIQELKAQRRAMAVDEIIKNKIALEEHASELVDSAVAHLKLKGINP
jgi:hypothetical protein